MSPIRVNFYASEAVRLRKLADDCSNQSLRIELLARAAELEELAMLSQDDESATPRHARVIH